MKFKAKAISPLKAEVHSLAILVTEDNWQAEIKEFNRVGGGALLPYAESDEFKAKEGQILAFPLSKSRISVLFLVGVGKKGDFDLMQLRRSIAAFGRRVKNKPSAGVVMTSDIFAKLEMRECAKTVVEGFVLGTYQFAKYKSEENKEKQVNTEIQLLVPASKLQYSVYGIIEGEMYAQGTVFSRDLINESPSVTTPAYLATIAKSLAKKSEVIVEILEEKDVRKLGMNSYLAVSRGSDEPPKFIKLTYKGGGKKKIVLAGKAITFDTGGLSLKDAKSMETMKLDMSGAAALLGVFSILPKLKPKVTVIGLIAACENMPGARATKPGDIVTALNGKSIEILNTDAEGRLTLADVLSYATREKPDYIVDLATLTGACMVALGEEIAGLFVNNPDLKTRLLNAAASAGEKLWELPLENDYKETLKSHITDLRNISTTRYGGAITAALFLEEFVDKLPWAHLDIAGPAFEEKDTPVVPKGGAGFGVRTILNFLKNL